MAQWNGQFTNNTHSTKVADLEAVLENAVSVFNTCSEELKPRKAKAVKKLAAKVLNARLKMIRAKLDETMPIESDGWKAVRKQVEHLEATETKLTSEGADGILREFHASELAEKPSDTKPIFKDSSWALPFDVRKGSAFPAGLQPRSTEARPRGPEGGGGASKTLIDRDGKA